MHPKLSQIFKNISEIDPPENISRNILMRIENIESRSLKRKLFFSYAGLIGSVTLIVYSGLTFGRLIIQSEFWRVASLFFSDMAVVMINWKEFLYSLLETFPIINTTMVLAPIVMLFYLIGINLDLHYRSKHKFV